MEPAGPPCGASFRHLRLFTNLPLSKHQHWEFHGGVTDHILGPWSLHPTPSCSCTFGGDSPTTWDHSEAAKDPPGVTSVGKRRGHWGLTCITKGTSIFLEAST